MDYENKYREALEMAREELQKCGSLDCDCAKQMFRLFPELCESEDEMIRKWLIDTLKGYHHLFEEGGVTKKDMLSLLEKQGNQKPTDNDMVEALRTEYEKGRADAIAEMRKKLSDSKSKRQEVIRFLESLRLKED